MAELAPSEVAAMIAGLARRGQLTFFVGAFVSSAPPASLPLAEPLKRGITESLADAAGACLAGAVDRAAVMRVRNSAGFRSVPLELMADEVLGKTGLTAGQLVGFMKSAAPNGNHVVLAGMLDSGMARVITTNFDELIEAARTRHGAPGDLWKVHGTVSAPQAITVRLPQVGRGIVSARLRRDLTAALHGRDIVFVGYSGTDLDLAPVLRTVAAASVLWIIRPRVPGESLDQVVRQHTHLAGFFAPRVPVQFVSADGAQIIAELGRLAGVPPTAWPAPARQPWLDALRSAMCGVEAWKAALALARIVLVSGSPELAAVILTELRDAARDAGQKATAALHLAEAEYLLGRFAESRAAARAAAAGFRRAGRDRDAAVAHQILSLIAERSPGGGNWAWRYMQKIAATAAGSEHETLFIANQLNMATWLKNRGRLAEAADVLRHALRSAQTAGDLRMQLRLHHATGIVYRHRRQLAVSTGDRAAARRAAATAAYHLNKAIGLAAALGDAASGCRAMSTLIEIRLDTPTPSALARAAKLLAAAEDQAARSPEPAQRGYALLLKGHWLLATGQHDQARTCLDQALTQLAVRSHQAEALRLRAQTRLAAADVDGARDDALAALQLEQAPGPGRQQTTRLLDVIQSRSA